MTDYQKIIDKYYPASSPLRDIYIRHCRAVADKALNIAETLNLPLLPQRIEAAAMLHDIGIFATNAPGIKCFGSEPYIRHGIIGADILRAENVDEEIAAAAELHTGSGITAAEIESQHLPLPARDFCPITQLQRLICYADKFFSKSGDMKEKTLEQARSSIAKFGSDSLTRFDNLHKEFSTV
ncbi:MAG: HD domain-containing protein [Paramuribaculum sp.]|nr:HD domain-containing protein [Paramuribaculum sp.]MDE5836863.1 HD domain-containing protein [Paramuribaculum sp.]